MAAAQSFHPDAKARAEMLTQMWAKSERRASQCAPSLADRRDPAADRPAMGPPPAP